MLILILCDLCIDLYRGLTADMKWYVINRRYRSYSPCSCTLRLHWLLPELILNWLGDARNGMSMAMVEGLPLMALLRFFRKHFRANDQWLQPRPRCRSVRRCFQPWLLSACCLYKQLCYIILPGFATWNREWKMSTCWSTSAAWACEAALKAIQLWQWCGSTYLEWTAYCRHLLVLSAFFPHSIIND